MSDAPLFAMELRSGDDLVHARRTARELAERLGFDGMDQTRLATGVSEVLRVTTRAKLEFLVRREGRPMLLVHVTDGGGPADATGASFLSGSGLAATRRLMDQFEIEALPSGGARITFGKHLPARLPPPGDEAIARIRAALAERPPTETLDEIRRQNRELLEALEQLRAQRAELATLNRELEDTNRGVVALYAELDDRAEYLQRVSELKTRFLSNMTHEFRTPLNSVLLLSQLLLERVDGPLTPEQEKQVHLVRRSAEELSETVNDLLDIAKVEAGKLSVQPIPFGIGELFGALRGMLRPLVTKEESVELVFETADESLTLHTDHRKVSQILRNFISNALKYTERGQVRVSAVAEPGDTVLFAVRDTGIGIAPEDHERIFEEFTQVDSALQRRVRGTGLGLPLARKLAGLLGGSLWVESAPGRGSSFFARIPARYTGATEPEAPGAGRAVLPRLLVLTDRTPALYESLLRDAGYELSVVREPDAAGLDAEFEAKAVVVDLVPHDRARAVAKALRTRPGTRHASFLLVGTAGEEATPPAGDGFLPEPLSRERLLGALRGLRRRPSRPRALIVDDDGAARYVLHGLLAQSGLDVSEATGGEDGLMRIASERPDVIFLDLSMPDMPGEEVLHRLKEDPAAQGIPVIVYSGLPESSGRLQLKGEVAAVLSKQSTTRERALEGVKHALAQAGLVPEETHG